MADILVPDSLLEFTNLKGVNVVFRKILRSIVDEIITEKFEALADELNRQVDEQMQQACNHILEHQKGREQWARHAKVVEEYLAGFNKLLASKKDEEFDEDSE